MEKEKDMLQAAYELGYDNGYRGAITIALMVVGQALAGVKTLEQVEGELAEIKRKSQAIEGMDF